LVGANGMIANFVERSLIETAGALERGDHSIEQPMHVVVHADAALIEVQNLPQLGRMDAQKANLLIEGQHLEHLGQINAGEIPS
jgi:hypothetical protein